MNLLQAIACGQHGARFREETRTRRTQNFRWFTLESFVEAATGKYPGKDETVVGIKHSGSRHFLRIKSRGKIKLRPIKLTYWKLCELMSESWHIEKPKQVNLVLREIEYAFVSTMVPPNELNDPPHENTADVAQRFAQFRRFARALGFDT